MTTESNNPTNQRPNFIAIGVVLGCCFMAAMQSPALFVVGLSLGIALDQRQRRHKQHGPSTTKKEI